MAKWIPWGAFEGAMCHMAPLAPSKAPLVLCVFDRPGVNDDLPCTLSRVLEVVAM